MSFLSRKIFGAPIIEPPAVGSRWVRFMDPCNKARIVTIASTGQRWIKIQDYLPGTCQRYWHTVEEFIAEFRPI